MNIAIIMAAITATAFVSLTVTSMLGQQQAEYEQQLANAKAREKNLSELVKKNLDRASEDRQRWAKAYGRLCEHKGRPRRCGRYCQQKDCFHYDPLAAWRDHDMKKNGWKLRRLGL